MRSVFSGVFALASFLVALSGCGNGDGGGQADLFEKCESGSDCRNADQECFRVAFVEGADGSMCSYYCETHDDCSNDGSARCYELVGDPNERRVCYLTCVDNLDCGVGFTCAEAENDDGVVESHICLPL